MSRSDASPPLSAAVRGAWAAGVCCLLWGLVPLYWKQLAGLNPLELVAHRYVWSLVLVLGLVIAQGRGWELRAALTNGRSVATNVLSGALLTGNWLVYIWGVNTGHVVETSLGYFLVPLVNVALGRLVLGEQLRRVQWIAIAAAAIGVAVMVAQLDRPPWIALTLASTWSSYGLMRKRSPLGSLTGLAAETILLFPVAGGFLLWQHQTGAGALGRVSAIEHILVLSSGLITAVPLLLFAYGARRIRLSTLGLLQYLAPTVQFALGVWYFHETFDAGRALGFAFIWAGLVVYTADNLLAQRRR